jgi:hypothetical protein
MKNRVYLVFVALLLFASCSQTGKLRTGNVTILSKSAGRSINCDSLQTHNSQYINKINAVISLNDEQYNARVSIYYIPDSVFYMSAVNSGFEIVRIGILPDSIVYINRLDKMVYVGNLDDFAAPTPLLFNDLEFLLNRKLVCDEVAMRKMDNGTVTIDRSVKDVAKEISYEVDNLTPIGFEFFQKKTGEYIVGELTADGIFVIYSNYIVENLKIEARNGEIEYNRDINIDLSVNRKKYDFFNF